MIDVVCIIYGLTGMIISAIFATIFAADKKTWVGFFIFGTILSLLLVFAKIQLIYFIIHSINS